MGTESYSNKHCESGAVYVFVRDGTQCQHEQTLLSPLEEPREGFDYDVSLFEDTALVAAPGVFGNLSEGAVHVFEHAPGTEAFERHP